MARRDYDQDKDSIKSFLGEFCRVDPESGKKYFVYASQLVKLVHREQTMLTIELDDLLEFNESLTNAVNLNCRRYSLIFADVIMEMLPNYKERETRAKDVLDVYIEHRLLMDARNRNQVEQRDERSRFPPELMKKL